MTEEHIPHNTGMDAVPEGPAESQPSQTPAAEPEFPLGPRDNPYLLLGVYIGICTAHLFSNVLMPLLDQVLMRHLHMESYQSHFVISISLLGINLLITFLFYRMFFGPLIPRIKEIWGYGRPRLPGAIKNGTIILTLALIFIPALYGIDTTRDPVQDTSIVDIILALCGTCILIAIILLVEFGVLYRIFLRFSMRRGLLLVMAAILLRALPLCFIIRVTMGASVAVMGTVVTVIMLEFAWGFYIYKRFNTLTPIALMMTSQGVAAPLLGYLSLI